MVDALQGKTGSKTYVLCRGVFDMQKSLKREALAQLTERGHSAPAVAKRIGASNKSLYDWLSQFGDAPDTRATAA